MSSKEKSNIQFDKIYNLIAQNQIKSAIESLYKLPELDIQSAMYLKLEQTDNNYKNLLTYFFNKVEDPSSNTIFNKIKTDLYDITDYLKRKNKIASGDFKVHQKKQHEYLEIIQKEEAIQNVDGLTFNHQLEKLLSETDLIKDSKSNYTLLTPNLFRILWLAEKYNEIDENLINSIRKSKAMPWYEKCVTVSAITLSFISKFDPKKIILLCDFYDDREEEVWQRALTGMVIAMLLYGNRIGLYENLLNRILVYKDDKLFSKDTTFLISRLLKSLETERLSKKFVNEILPDVVQFESKIKDKINIEDLLNINEFEDKNPDWEEILGGDNQLINRIEEISEMQISGSDLFMGTFSMYKNYPFFDELSNWFRPFYKENKNIQNVFSDEIIEKDNILQNIENSFYICNSDKYSFLFNLGNLPPSQTNQIAGFLKLEAEQLKELLSEEKFFDPNDTKSFIFTQYIQDLYRFFKLHPNRNEFVDFFDLDWILDSGIIIELQGVDNQFVQTAADFFFKNKYYSRAIKLFQFLEKNSEPNKELLEKIGYCFQMSNAYKQAIDYYVKVELFETNSIWAINRIVYCYKKLGDNKNALEWALKAKILEPENISVIVMIADIYSDSGMYDESVNYFTKALNIKNNDLKILRALAYNAFRANNFELTHSLLKNNLKEKITNHDFIYFILALWILNDKYIAIDEIKKFLSEESFTKNDLLKIISQEKSTLLQNSILQKDLQWLCDYIVYL